MRRPTTKPKDFPNYYTPGAVKTHKMTEEEKKEFEEAQKRRRNRFPWRNSKKAKDDADAFTIGCIYKQRKRDD